jgi:putative ABC transport system permease protein
MMLPAYAWRFLARRPAFSTALVLTLALGIGANTAMFSLARAVVLRPLPYHDPERLVFVWSHRAGAPIVHERHGILTGTDVLEWQRRATSLESVAVISSSRNNPTDALDLVTADGTERLRAAAVTPNFFELLGVTARVGRTFTSADDGEGTPLVVISHAFWERRFAGDPSVIGQTVDLLPGRGERQRYTIVGVLPAGFRFTYPLETEVWRLLPWTRVVPSRALDFEMIARLKPDVTPGQAQAELTPVAQDISRAWGLPDDFVRDQAALVETVAEHAAGEARSGVLLLAGAAGVVMLIACVNVALLLVAMLVDRRREMAVRAAIGARPGQLVAQVLTESALLGVLGAALGLMLAWLLLPVLRALVPTTLPRGDEVSLDPVVFLFAVGLAMAAALTAGLVPAWYVRGGDVQSGLLVSSAATTGDRRLRVWRHAVVAAQTGVVLVLLVGAALLLHSFWRMHRVDLGFAGGGVITMEMLLLNSKYREPARVAEFERQVMERVRALSGVAQAQRHNRRSAARRHRLRVCCPTGGRR